MGRRKKQKWEIGDIFAIPLKDGTFALAQILNVQFAGAVGCAVFDAKLTEEELPEAEEAFKKARLVGRRAVFPYYLEDFRWKVVGHAPITVPVELFPNERFRPLDWEGATYSDPDLLEAFCNAFYALEPWDKWCEPDYLDTFLISPEVKPKKLLYCGRHDKAGKEGKNQTRDSRKGIGVRMAASSID